MDNTDRAPVREGRPQSRERRCVVTTKRDNSGRAIVGRVCRAMRYNLEDTHVIIFFSEIRLIHRPFNPALHKASRFHYCFATMSGEEIHIQNIPCVPHPVALTLRCYPG